MLISLLTNWSIGRFTWIAAHHFSCHLWFYSSYNHAMSDKPNRYHNQIHTSMTFRGGLYYMKNQSTLSWYMHNNNLINMPKSCLKILTTYHDLMHDNHDHENPCITTSIHPIWSKFLNHALIPLYNMTTFNHFHWPIRENMSRGIL